jgi:hypothetical protein
MTPLHLSDLSPALRQRLGFAPGGKRRSKFNATRTVVDGERFDSQREAQRFGELRYRETAGEIENLQRQPQYLITINGAVGAGLHCGLPVRRTSVTHVGCGGLQGWHRHKDGSLSAAKGSRRGAVRD